MALYVYNSVTGALVSWCPNDNDPVAPSEQLAARGLLVVSGLPALDDTHAWDEATHNVIVVAAPATVRALPTWQFIMRFTAVEFAAITDSQDASVRQFMLALNRTVAVNLNDPIIAQALQYLVSLGLLTSQRASAIRS